MSCRGINRKHLSAGDWFWKIGFHNLLWRWGLWKSFEILRFPFFFSISPTSKAGYDTKFSKSRHQQRGFCTKNHMCDHQVTFREVLTMLAVFDCIFIRSFLWPICSRFDFPFVSTASSTFSLPQLSAHWKVIFFLSFLEGKGFKKKEKKPNKCYFVCVCVSRHPPQFPLFLRNIRGKIEKTLILKFFVSVPLNWSGWRYWHWLSQHYCLFESVPLSRYTDTDTVWAS